MTPKLRWWETILCILLFLAPFIICGLAVLPSVPGAWGYWILALIPTGGIIAGITFKQTRLHRSFSSQAAQAYLVGATIPFVVFLLPLLIAYVLSWLMS